MSNVINIQKYQFSCTIYSISFNLSLVLHQIVTVMPSVSQPESKGTGGDVSLL